MTQTEMMYRGEEVQSTWVFCSLTVLITFTFCLTGKKHGTIIGGRSGRKWESVGERCFVAVLNIPWMKKDG